MNKGHSREQWILNSIALLVQKYRYFCTLQILCMVKTSEWPAVNKEKSGEERVLHKSRVGRSGYCSVSDVCEELVARRQLAARRRVQLRQVA